MSEFYRGYKYKIYPTEDQKTLINTYIDQSRYVYNWAIAKEYERSMEYEFDESNYIMYGFYDLCKIYKEFKSLPENSWLQISNSTARLAIRNAINAFTKYYKWHNNKPKFKSKKNTKRSFNTRNDRFYVFDGKIRFEGLPGRVDSKTPESSISLGFDLTKFNNCKHFINPTISIDKSGDYYVSFSILEESKPLNKPKTEPIGIDLGVRQTMALSTGEIFNRPKDKIKRLDKRISRVQHHITRDINRRITESKRTKTKYEDIPKSNRALKREARYHKLLDKRHNIKNNWYHETIKSIIERNPEAIILEDIKFVQLQKQGKFISKKIDKADFIWMRKIFEENCEMNEIPIILADANYPSSQIKIGSRHTYICPVCGMRMDRDINAAINLRNLYNPV